MVDRQRGDTLVEVLMAMIILSMVIVGGITLMTRGLSASQTASEHTQVQLSINAEAEYLTYMRNQYIQSISSPGGQGWLSLFSGATPYANTTPSVDTNACVVTPSKRAFYLTEDTVDTTKIDVIPFSSATVPAGPAQPGAGLWVEATRSNGLASGASNFVTFEIRACWNNAGAGAKQQEVRIVRIYDPAH